MFYVTMFIPAQGTTTKHNLTVDAARNLAKYIIDIHNSKCVEVTSITVGDDADLSVYHEWTPTTGWATYTRPEHKCVLRETPDGFACAECLYS